MMNSTKIRGTKAYPLYNDIFYRCKKIRENAGKYMYIDGAVLNLEYILRGYGKITVNRILECAKHDRIDFGRMLKYGVIDSEEYENRIKNIEMVEASVRYYIEGTR